MVTSKLMCINSIIPEIWHICPQLKNNNSHFSNFVEYNLECDPSEAYMIPNVHQMLNGVKESYCWQLLIDYLFSAVCILYRQFSRSCQGLGL